MPVGISGAISGASAFATDVYVQRLTLTHFRNYEQLQLDLPAMADGGGAPVVLYGPTGAGKTNLLEA